jgi:protein phosphatase
VADAPLRTDGSTITALVHGRTDIGRAREHNEDAFVAADFATLTPLEPLPAALRFGVDRPGPLLMVADGMGGAAAGEIASAMAVTAVLETLGETDYAAAASDPDLFAAALRGVLETVNGQIHNHATANLAHRGMGTTATLAVTVGDTLYVAQVGDSRAYLVRNGEARQLTKDQSLIQKLIDDGELTPEEAERSERRNIILQALGPEPLVRVDVTHQRLRRGDAVIICTDGLSGLVSATELARAADEEPTVADVCDRLIGAANTAGGFDNITVVAARFDGAALASAAAGDEVGYRPVGGVTTSIWRATPAAALARILTPAGGPAVDATPERAAVQRSVGPIYALLALAVVVLAVLAVLRLVP